MVIASSNRSKVDAAVHSLGAGTSGAVVDVTDEASIVAFFSAPEHFDHLVFTAGEPGGFVPASMAQLDIVAAADGLQVRFWGALRVIKHALSHLSARGSITLTDGLLAHLPRKGVPLATAFAGATEYLVRGLAVDVAPIRVNAACPGPVQAERLAGLPAEMIRQTTERQPLPRAAHLAEVAQAFLYLMRGGYTTVQILIVDGGHMLV